jgi:hypothetical protein
MAVVAECVGEKESRATIGVTSPGHRFGDVGGGLQPEPAWTRR